MALRSDKARLLRKVDSEVRVEGGYQKITQTGPWFRCAYDAGTESEEPSDGGHRRKRAGATVTTARRALDGSLIDVDGTMRVEVDSHAHGRFVMDVRGTPKRLVLGRVWSGWEIALQKVNRDKA